MRDKKLYDLLNEKMATEISASYFYFDLETQAMNMNYFGFAKKLASISKKHYKNAIQYRNNILSLKGLPIGKSIDQGREKKFSSVQEIAKAALRKEKELTRITNEILWYAWDSKEWLAINFLKTELEEQNKLMNKIEKIEFMWSKAQDEIWLDNKLGE